jgi:hypothetical protein
MTPNINDIFDSIEENSEDVFSQDPSYRVPLRDTLEYYDDIYEDIEDDE